VEPLTTLSATQLAQLIRTRQLSAREVVEAHLDRIDKVNPALNAVVQRVDREELMRQADAADSMKGPLGPLHGVPITVKDAHQVKGLVCCAGCPGLRAGPATEDATVVRRLREAGAIVLGLTNVPELLLNYESDSSLYGRANNPHDVTRTPGGSSGGEGAILAAGGSALGMATDAAGSIRVPAHYCGIAGLKPTHGRVPRTGSVMGDAGGMFSPIATPGPMARCVDDLALALSIIAGPDGIDPWAVPVPLGDPRQVDVGRLRIAYYTHDGLSPATPETIQAVERAARALGNRCLTVEEHQPAALERTFSLVWETVFLGGDEGEGLEAWLRHLKITEPSPALIAFRQLSRNLRLSVAEVRARFREMDSFRIEMLRAFAPYDAILCPVMATPAKLHGDGIKEFKDGTYSMAHNLTGWPVVVVRCGTSPEGLPIGLQVVAKPWRDEIALAVAKELESLLGAWAPIKE